MIFTMLSDLALSETALRQFLSYILYNEHLNFSHRKNYSVNDFCKHFKPEKLAFTWFYKTNKKISKTIQVSFFINQQHDAQNKETPDLGYNFFLTMINNQKCSQQPSPSVQCPLAQLFPAPLCPNTKLSGRKIWPKGPDLKKKLFTSTVPTQNSFNNQQTYKNSSNNEIIHFSLAYPTKSIVNLTQKS